MRMLRSVLTPTAVVAAILLLDACSSSTPPPTPAAVAPVISATDRLNWYQACWEQFNTARFDEFAKCYAADATSQQLGYGPPSASGAAAIVAASQDFKKAFPDGRGDAVLTLINGNRIVSVHVLHGTNTGPMTEPGGHEAAATNKPLSVVMAHYVELQENALKVSRELGVMDSGSVAWQLGLSKVPARPAALPAPADAALVVVATNDATEAANLQAEAATITAFNNHDNKAMQPFMSDDYVFHGYADAKDSNLAGQLAMNKEFWGAFPDAKLAVTTWSAGDYVVTTGTFSGTNNGPMPSMKLKKTGKTVELPFIQIDRFAGGKVVEEWLFYDNGAFAAQLMAKPAA